MKIAYNAKTLVASILTLSIATCFSLGLFAYYFNNGLYTATKDISANWFPSVTAISKMRADLNQLRRAEARVLLQGKACSASPCTDQLNNTKAQLARAEAVYEPLVTPFEERVLFESYKLQRAVYLNLMDQMLEHGDYDKDTMQKFLTESSEAFEVTTEILDRLSDFNSNEGARAQTVAQKYYSKSQICLYVMNIFLFVIAAVLITRLAAILMR